LSGLKNILFATLILLLLVPLTQQIYPWINLEPLKGAVVEPDKPVLTKESWWSGQFQQEFGAYYEYHIGLRPFLIRLRNQLYYWLYDQSTTYVVPGENDQFFSWDYWAAYRGLDFAGADSITARVERIGLLRDQLRRSGKELLVVIAPNKVRYMPEYLPERLDELPGEETNYERYLHALKRAGIPLLDFNNRFEQAKDTVLKPLFSNTSIHWSGYGMHLAISEIIDTLEVLGQRNHINMRYADWVMKDSAISSDRDMVDLMNLLFPPSTESLAFPDYNLDTSGTASPVKMLLVGDSFFWNFYSFPVRHQIFASDSRFWYYNKTQMDLAGNRTPVDSLSATRAVTDADYVIILATESNLDQFPYGFPRDYLNDLKKR
jgi:hypothetical protein